MLCVQRLGRTPRLGVSEDLLVVDVAPLLHLAGGPLAPHHDDLLEAREIAHDLVYAILDGSGPALACGAVDGDQHLGLGELHALAHSLGGKSAEDHVVRSADARAGEHRDHDLGDHRQVDPDHVAPADAKALQRAGEAFDLGEQGRVGDVALGAVLAAPVEGDAIASAGDHVTVQAVVGDVQSAAREPLVERRIVVVEHARPPLKPVQRLSLPRPPCLRVACGLLVHAGITQQRVLVKLGGRLERLDVQERCKLSVKHLARDALGFRRHGSPASAALAPPA